MNNTLEIMNFKPGQEQSIKLSAINKQILEVKKKIQLSEGQRKALFEVCETERKSNTDEILNVKKQISHLIVQLHKSKFISSKIKFDNKQLELIIGSFNEKTIGDIQQLVDLQIIDKNKQLNLIRYRIRQRRKYLMKIGEEYQILLSEKTQNEIIEKVDNPNKKTTSELQNSIHAVEVQLRESNHIYIRYRDIKRTLQDESAQFESYIKKLEGKLQLQRDDINKLQKVMDEATRMRSKARSHLLYEERSTTTLATTRERQTTEGKRLLNIKKHELEQLEKHIFQRGKIIQRSEPEGADDALMNDEDISETSPQPDNDLLENFETLKCVTGETSTEEILKRFNSQKETQACLLQLRKRSENEKLKLEKRLGLLTAELDHYKYIKVKEDERKSAKLEQVVNLNNQQQERSHKYKEETQNIHKSISMILFRLQELFLSINPFAESEGEILKIIQNIDEHLRRIIQQKETGKIDNLEEKEIPIHDDRWLPPPYNGLVRRTPLPQSGSSPVPPPTPVSDDDDEVPSRGYLKRQAQLVFDAKSRRKNIRTIRH